jgi:hypothetical protein
MKSYEGRSPTPLRHKLLRAVLLLSLILVGGFYIYGTSSNSSGQHTQAALDEITLARLAHTTPQTPVTRSAQMSELRGANRANEHSQKMLNMTENQRNAYWTLFLRESGEKCDRVVRTMFRSSVRNSDDWSVACRDGNAYSIGIDGGSEGKSKILGCKELETILRAAGRRDAKNACWG